MLIERVISRLQDCYEVSGAISCSTTATAVEEAQKILCDNLQAGYDDVGMSGGFKLSDCQLQNGSVVCKIVFDKFISADPIAENYDGYPLKTALKMNLEKDIANLNEFLGLDLKLDIQNIVLTEKN